jgi:hypothetical protein
MSISVSGCRLSLKLAEAVVYRTERVAVEAGVNVENVISAKVAAS